jgi:hypothetical protein
MKKISDWNWNCCDLGVCDIAKVDEEATAKFYIKAFPFIYLRKFHNFAYTNVAQSKYQECYKKEGIAMCFSLKLKILNKISEATKNNDSIFIVAKIKKDNKLSGCA